MIVIRLCTLTGVALAASFLLVAEYLADTNTPSAMYRSANGDRVAQDDDSGNAQAPAAATDTGNGDDSNGPADDSNRPGQDQE